MKWLHLLVEKGYDRFHKNKNLLNTQVVMDLVRLHPGADKESLCREYYIKKLEKVFLIFAGGTGLAILLIIKAINAQQLKEGYLVPRNALFEDSETIRLERYSNGKKDKVEVEVAPMKLSISEVENRYVDFCSNLPQLIVGDNESLEKVICDLKLEDYYDGYPFEVEWKSSNIDAISSSGIVHVVEMEQPILLTATIAYAYSDYDFEQVLEIPVTVSAIVLPKEEQRKQEILREISLLEESSREQEFLELPTQDENGIVTWKREMDKTGFYVLIGVLILSVAVFILSDQDIHRELEQKKLSMKREYPDIVYKLTLYLGAGMTLQRAFMKLGSQYEQIQYTCRELQSGVSESVAYEQFGKRTGLQEYIRLSTLMTQNLRKGSSGLLQRLQEETDRVFTEKLQAGRKLGEEASTKLLLPMVVMLGVVMVMIMLPAFYSMGL